MTFLINANGPNSESQQQCPKALDGLTHHYIPRRWKGGTAAVMTCIFCEKTEKEIRDEHTA